ncbi:substrate-binding periplasmic protein [Pseudomonas sp. DC3000-4b1]|uniref:substrate-binding periplasmic protein n=1 Tax=unclassified Pseudomonas TaxID=196821 RepID=UPI003CE8A9DB
MRALAISLLALLLCPMLAMAGARSLHLVTNPWEPYVYRDGATLKGIDYEIASEVFRRLGIEVEWELLPWKRCLMMLDRGQADGALDIFRTSAREALLVYALEPLSTVNFVFFQAQARPLPLARLGTLQGVRVGIAPGFVYGPEFNASLAIQEPAPTLEANFGKLLLGRVDLVISDRRQGHAALEHLGLTDRVEEIPRLVHRDVLYLALRREGDGPSLAERFAGALRAFKREPGYRRLLERYGM